MNRHISVSGIDTFTAVQNLLEKLNSGEWEYLTQCPDEGGAPYFILRSKPVEQDPDAIADRQAIAARKLNPYFQAGSV